MAATERRTGLWPLTGDGAVPLETGEETGDPVGDAVDDGIGDETASASVASSARCTPTAVAVGTAVRDRVATSAVAKPASVAAPAAVRPAEDRGVACTTGADDVDATDGARPVETVGEDGDACENSEDGATSDDATGNEDGADSVTNERAMPRLAGSAPAFELPMLRRRTTITP